MGVVEERVIRTAAERASAAAALVLDRVDFGFPGPAEIDAALRAGRIFQKVGCNSPDSASINRTGPS